MSHSEPPVDLWDFNAVGGMDSMMSAEAQGDHMMSLPLLDSNSAFNPFGAIPMTLDGSNGAAATGMSQPFTPVSGPSNPRGALLSAGDQQPFRVKSEDDAPALGHKSDDNSAVVPQSGAEDDSAAASGFAHQGVIPGGSTLTEFTKRRNWPAKVLEELQDILQILDANGRIVYVTPNITALTGWAASDVVGQLLSELIHPDDSGVFVAELNESIATGNKLRLFYRLRKKDGKYGIFESVGHAHIAGAQFAPNPNNQSPFCQAVFMMTRPYPTRNSSLLDSFLEHKIENERLKRRIQELRKEEEDEADEAKRTWRQSQEERSEMAVSEDTLATTTTTSATIFFRAGGTGGAGSIALAPSGGASNSAFNGALTRENLEGVAGSRPDSIRDKMARYEGTNQPDTIEMLTGLRYQEGERSRGISMGNGSPILIKGDAGIAIPIDRDPRSGEKKKKAKMAEEYVCTDCGTLESPEWRKGPRGPKTLCNACGLRWAKKEKKKSTGSGAAAVDPGADH